MVALVSTMGLGVGRSASADPTGARADRPKRPRALVLGDSVMAMVGVAPEALAELNEITPVVFGAEGCQLLLSPGCMPGVDKSAYQRFREARGRFSDVVVVATGYNEYKDESLVDALKLFRDEAKRQKVTLLWLTYRESGNVVGKAKRFNAILRRAAKRDDSLVLFDWHTTSQGRESWFSGDKVHLSRGGAKQMARRLGKVIDRVVDARRQRKFATPTTTTTVLQPVSDVPTETTTSQG